MTPKESEATMAITTISTTASYAAWMWEALVAGITSQAIFAYTDIWGHTQTSFTAVNLGAQRGQAVVSTPSGQTQDLQSVLI